MWPYTDEENDRQSRDSRALARPQDIIVTSEMVDFHIARAHRLRAQAMAAHFARLAAWFRPRRRARESEAAHQLRTPLTSVRSSAEILRDNPDMPAEHRKRFLGVILQECDRLNSAIGNLTDQPAAAGRGAMRR